MVAQLVSEANGYFDAQREKSRRGYEKSQRKFRKLGLLPQQLAERFPPRVAEAVDFRVSESVVDLGEESAPEYAPLHAGQDNGANEQKAAQFFLVEYFADNGVWDEVTGLRGDTAKSLIPATQAQAKLNLGTRYRIRRNDGTRAVHRIAARKVKGKSTVELYAWST